MPAPRRVSLPPLQFEDYLSLLRILVVCAWIGIAGALFAELWIRSSPALEWPALDNFSLTFNAMLIEFSVNTAVLTLLLLRGDWYERVPRASALRLGWLLTAVLTWFGLHVVWAFYLSGALSGPLLPLLPVLLLAALLALPAAAGIWTVAGLLTGHLAVLALQQMEVLQSPSPLAAAFAYAGPEATALGLTTLLLVLMATVTLALLVRGHFLRANLALGHGWRLDPVTGLFRQQFLVERIERELGRERRQGGESSLLLINVEGLVGDPADSRGADERLQQTAAVLMDVVRLNSDTPTRYGLTTLAVLLPTANADGVRRVIQRIVAATSGINPQLPLRYGAARITRPAETTPDHVLKCAEQALRQSQAGADPVVLEAGPSR